MARNPSVDLGGGKAGCISNGNAYWKLQLLPVGKLMMLQVDSLTDASRRRLGEYVRRSDGILHGEAY